MSLTKGSLEDVDAWLQTCGYKHTDTVSLHHVIEYLQLAKVLTEYGAYPEALQILENLYQLVHNENRLRDKIRVFILQSLVFHRMGDEGNALMKLEAALGLAERSEYLRSFVDAGNHMADLLCRYIEHRQDHHSSVGSSEVSLLYVNKILQLMNETSKGGAVSWSLLTKQELKIIRMLEKGMSNKQIAEQLRVTVETVKSHMKNINRKLGVNSRLQALQRGKELNLL